MGLHAQCKSDWHGFARGKDVGMEELDSFLDYAATFLSNIGNYYVSNPSSIKNYANSDILGFW